MATVATLTVDLVAQSTKFVTGLRKANAKTDDWAKKTRTAVNSGAKVFAGMAAATTAAMAAIYASTAKSADQLAKFSDEIGEAPERVTALQHAAQITGVSQEKMTSSLERMTKRLGEASNGSGEAARYLDRLGLSNQAFFQQSPADQFASISEKINSLNTQQEKAAAAAAIFGREGVALINTMALGKEGLSAMEAEVVALGGTLDRVDMAKVEAANDSMTRLKLNSGALGRSLTVELAPFVGALTDHFVNAAKEAGGFDDIAKKVIDNLGSGIGFVADSVHGLNVVWKGTKSVALSTISAVVGGIAWLDKSISELLNKIRGIEVQASQSLQTVSTEMASTAESAREDFQNALMQPMPSKKVKAVMEDIHRKAEVAAKEVAANRQENIASTLLGNDSGAGSTVAGQKELEKIVQQLATEEEQIRASHKKRKDIILANTADTDAKRKELIARNDAQLQQELIDINRNKYGQLDGMLQGYVGNVMKGQKSLQNSTVDLLRELALKHIKAKALESEASGLAAIQQAWASAPFPANLAAVATTTGKVLLNTAAISALSPSFDGGGFTGNGPRSGGLDGKGGFLAMMHPRETVIDHTKGQPVATNVVVNLFENPDRAGEVVTSENRIDIYIERIRASMIDDVNRGRGLGSAIKDKYGLTTRGIA